MDLTNGRLIASHAIADASLDQYRQGSYGNVSGSDNTNYLRGVIAEAYRLSRGRFTGRSGFQGAAPAVVIPDGVYRVTGDLLTDVTGLMSDLVIRAEGRGAVLVFDPPASAVNPDDLTTGSDK